jgi:hypothetical protein
MQSLFALSVKFSQLSASKYSCVTSQQSQLTMSGPLACRDNGTDERQEEIVHVGLVEVSSKFVWENMDSFPTSRETFCNVYGPQFNTAELDVVSVFENILDITLEKHGSAVSRPVYGCPSHEPLPNRLTERHFLERIPATGQKAKPQKRCIVCSKHGNGRNQFIGILNVSQGCV